MKKINPDIRCHDYSGKIISRKQTKSKTAIIDKNSNRNQSTEVIKHGTCKINTRQY